MQYLCDTNILIDHLRKKKTLEESIGTHDFFVSVITIAELYTGAHKSQNPQKNLLDLDLLIYQYGAVILNIDDKIAKIYSEQRAYLELNGIRIEDMDLFIAATALSHNLQLITNNKKHFEKIPNLKMWNKNISVE